MKFQGLEEMLTEMTTLPKEAREDSKMVVRNSTAYMLRRAQGEAHFRRYPVKNPNAKLTGNLRRSIKRKFERGGLLGKVEAKADYAAYVEYGTRKMKAQPYMRPAFEDAEKRFIDDLKKLVK